jgi:hypothetical protein
MNRFLPNAFCLLTLSLAAWTLPCVAQTPSIAPALPFTVPLTNNQTGQAVLLQIDATQAWLVCTDKTGQIAFYRMTTSPSPGPGPSPQPPTPPTPPTPPPAKAAAIITVTDSDPAQLPAAVAAYATNAGLTYAAFTVAMVADPQPPPNALTWIGRTAGKKYPYTFVAATDGAILWQGQTPPTSDNFLSVLRNVAPTTSKPVAADCPDCPPQRSRRR